jgi:hypothetical protein
MSTTNDPGATIRGFAATVQGYTQTVFVNSASAALDSITNGSAVTGAPGQPVDTGALKASYQLTFTSPKRFIITSPLPYALANEDGVNNGRPYIQRSPVGGRHSVALTVLGMQRIVDVAVAESGG